MYSRIPEGVIILEYKGFNSTVVQSWFFYKGILGLNKKFPERSGDRKVTDEFQGWQFGELPIQRFDLDSTKTTVNTSF